VQRREDPGGERGRAAAVEQHEKLVQVDRRLVGELGRELRLEAGRPQPAPAPLAKRDALRRSSRI